MQLLNIVFFLLNINSTDHYRHIRATINPVYQTQLYITTMLQLVVKYPHHHKDLVNTDYGC